MKFKIIIKLPLEKKNVLDPDKSRGLGKKMPRAERLPQIKVQAA